jgi:hypothetical protein
MLLLIRFPVTDKPTRRAVGPARNRVAAGHMRRRRLAALWKARARKKKEDRNRCPRRCADFAGIILAQPPPSGPRRHPKCAVLETRKAHSACRPQGSGQMPPRQPSRPDRDAFGPASRTSCLPCRHVAALGPAPTHRPCPDPGLSAPERKARRQAPDAVLANCGCIRRFTVCLSCSGRKPSASIVPPWPWPCRPTTAGVPLAAAGMPPHRPPLDLWPPEAGGRPVALAAARGSRAGERLPKKAGEVSPDPSFSARDLQPPHSRRYRHPRSPTVIPHANRVPEKSPAGRCCAVGRAGCTGLPALGSSLQCRVAAQSGLRGNALLPACLIQRVRAKKLGLFSGRPQNSLPPHRYACRKCPSGSSGLPDLPPRAILSAIVRHDAG